ncbi:sigma-70 family RNA polymerase sigma factor [Candidatus Microgenomates bacterium]|nr:sigma-70 family RNA polymerase sigma factor [Candidatus Microgenomates bacterium]
MAVQHEQFNRSKTIIHPDSSEVLPYSSLVNPDERESNNGDLLSFEEEQTTFSEIEKGLVSCDDLRKKGFKIEANMLDYILHFKAGGDGAKKRNPEEVVAEIKNQIMDEEAPFISIMELFSDGQVIKAKTEQIKKATAAVNRLIEANIGLVKKIAGQEYEKNEGSNRGIDFRDVVQAGLFKGIPQAIGVFRWRDGLKFSTCATWWIRSAAQREMAGSRTIHIPFGVQEKVTGVDHAKSDFQMTHGREPSTEELQTYGFSKEEVERVDRARRMDPGSFDQPINSPEADKELSRAYFIADDDPETQPETAVEQTVGEEKVEELLSLLTNRERMVVEFHLGLNNQKKHTLEEIGIILGITRERARQIEAKAFKKMVTSEKAAELRDLVDFQD